MADQPTESQLSPRSDPAPVIDGAALIAAERQRQADIARAGTDQDPPQIDGQLVDAAILYARAGLIAEHADHTEAVVRRALDRLGVVPEEDEDFRQMQENPARHHFGWDKAPKDWPWPAGGWEPSADPVENLVKAGALIAAEIDRLRRA